MTSLLLLVNLRPVSLGVVPEYERNIAERLTEQYRDGLTNLEIEAEANWNMSLYKSLELVGTVVPHFYELSMEGGRQRVVFHARTLTTNSRSELEALASEVLSNILHPNMTVREKVAAMYRWIILNTTFSLEAATSTGEQRSSNYAYAFCATGPLVYGSAVCDGYSRVLMLLCQLEGIPCVRIGSSKMNHSYNAIWIDGEWLLCDPTWDTPESGNSVSTKYFLIEPELMTSHETDSGLADTLSYEDIISFAQWYYADFFGTVEGIDEDTHHTSSYSSTPTTPFVPTDEDAFASYSPKQFADFLFRYNLFRGTDQGYELDRALRRDELAALFIRVLGQEQISIQQSLPTFFVDVSAWAAPIIAYLYENGLVFGVSETHFGSAYGATSRDYAALLLRAMGYQEGVEFNWETASDTAAELGFAAKRRPSSTSIITRADAVEMTVRSLFVEMPGRDGNTFGRYLVEIGVLNSELALADGILVD